MSLERLWAGWRGEYVSSMTSEPEEGGAEPPEGPGRCVFCRLASSGPPSADTGVLWRGARTYAVLNAFPYASGHLMVLPLRHVPTLADLEEDEAAELWQAVRDAVAAIEAAYGPEGVNLGANLGLAAGAGIPRHLHLHAVPRWLGDTNFMTAVAETRVLPEALGRSWERLAGAWPA